MNSKVLGRTDILFEPQTFKFYRSLILLLYEVLTFEIKFVTYVVGDICNNIDGDKQK